MNVTRQDEMALYPELDWSLPQNKRSAGTITIIGGHKFDVTKPMMAYQTIKENGSNGISVILPKKVPPILGKNPDVTLVEATDSGGISAKAESTLQEMMSKSKAILWPGSLGRDSETIQLLERLAQTTVPSVITNDGADELITLSSGGEDQPTLVLSMGQVQVLQRSAGITTAVTTSMQMNHLEEALTELTKKTGYSLLTVHNGQILVAYADKICLTHWKAMGETSDELWRTELAAIVAVYLAATPEKPFEALTAAAFKFKEGKNG